MIPRGRLLLNFAGFQIGWFACVLGAAHSWPWLGPVAVGLLAAWHLAHAPYPLSELNLLLIGTAFGTVFDQALLSAGWIAYPASTWPAWLLPPWMSALWLGFCATLNISMRWLRRYPLIAVAFGVIGGPLAYWSGARLGAMVWLQPLHVAAALALGWGATMPAFLKLSAIHDGYRPKEAT
jgi:hypothetical protein